MPSFKLEIDGEKLSFQSEEDAARFFLAKQRLSEISSIAIPRSKKEEAEQEDLGEYRVAFQLLNVIASGGDKGVDPSDVVKALGISDPKGIGSRLMPIKSAMKKLGVEVDDVFVREKIPGVGRFWKPGQKFKSAYDAVKRKVEG